MASHTTEDARTTGVALTRRQALAWGAIAAGATLAACSRPAAPDEAAGDGAQAGDARIDGLLASMDVEQKLAQLVMPAIRTWEGEDNGVLSLDDAPKLAEALRRHQYGGVILFGANVEDAGQTVRLVAGLQKNNAEGAAEQGVTALPYLVAADQEGGSVARLSMGTRGTGSMAIGATGRDGYQSARDTGTVFGVELAALGINVNLGPCADVIRDLADPGMATRVFSDDADVVGELSQGFAEGVATSGVVSCFKHFPGVGDGSDDPTSEPITLDELRTQGLAVFGELVANGAEMVMASAVTFPAFDDPHLLADGRTRGHYPATMSPRVVGGLLREELGFDGVVITDALEMEQFVTEPDTGAQLLPGEPHSAEQGVEIAVACLEAGCDILLIPCDLNGEEAARWYEDYLAGLVAKVGEGAVSEERVDESVRRVLALKEAHGVLDVDTGDEGVDEAVAAAQESVGSEEHHRVERDIAEAAVTLLKGEGVLPVPGEGARVVILGRAAADDNPIRYALGELTEAGVVSADAWVDDRIAGETAGEQGVSTQIFVDRYYDFDEGLVWSDDLSAAIAEADYVVCMDAIWAGVDSLQDDDPRMQAIGRALGEAHAAGATFVLVDNNLPVGAARFPEADAVVCSYLSSGFDVDPTTGGGSEHVRAINANAPAALRAVFGLGEMPGQLPIDVHALERGADGTWSYADEVLYARGSGA